MFKLLKIIKDAGNVTTKYPFVPAKLEPAFRGKPEHNPKQCIACAACTMACPPNALTMETDIEKGERIWQLFVGQCVYCGRCEEVCPTRAIKLGKNFELSVFSKEDLYERASFSLCSCRVCGKAFAPQKEVEYALTLTLLHRGIEEDSLLRTQFETCPACKRKACVNDNQ